jgi:CBS domain-containing protein
MVVGPETPLAKAIPLMTTHQLPAMPVVDGPHVVGIVTLRAALDHLGALWKWERDVA